MEFKAWLEAAEESDPYDIWMNLNMTRSLPTGIDMAHLDRKFHLNTVIGRLYGHWHVAKVPDKSNPHRDKAAEVATKRYMSQRFDLADEEGNIPPNPYRADDGQPTPKFYAAYKVWDGYMKDIVASIGAKDAKDARTGKVIDFLSPTRQQIGQGQPGTDIVKAIKTAAKIDEVVIGPLTGGRGRDYANFMELLADIFDDPEYEEASRDFYELSSGSRTMPAEDIEDFIQKFGATELKGPRM